MVDPRRAVLAYLVGIYIKQQLGRPTQGLAANVRRMNPTPQELEALNALMGS